MYNYSVFDAHCDTLCLLNDEGGTVRKNGYNVDIERMMCYRSYTQVFACFIAPEYKTNAMSRFNALADCYDSQDFSGITPILSVEDGSMINSVEDVEYLYSRGVRAIALTWNGTNQIAGGADDDVSGLSELGHDVIRKMNELGILVDVSHLNDKSFYDVAKINTKPLIATHSNSRTVCAHRRNLTDDMFKVICESGGCAGINLYQAFLNDNACADIGDILKHIDHFMMLGGENHIGIGADFDGVDNNLPNGISGCGDLHKLFEAMEYSYDTIEKITHANFERVFGGARNA